MAEVAPQRAGRFLVEGFVFTFFQITRRQFQAFQGDLVGVAVAEKSGVVVDIVLPAAIISHSGNREHGQQEEHPEQGLAEEERALLAPGLPGGPDTGQLRLPTEVRFLFLHLHALYHMHIEGEELRVLYAFDVGSK